MNQVEVEEVTSSWKYSSTAWEGCSAYLLEQPDCKDFPSSSLEVTKTVIHPLENMTINPMLIEPSGSKGWTH